MRFSKRRHATLPDLNMTPMIDVVFQLLIFFMTVSQVSNINMERLELPKLDGTEDQTRTTLTINASRDGQLRIAGKRITLAGVVGMVAIERDRLQGDVSRMTIVVRADERGPSRVVNEVVAALAELGIRRIRVAVESPR